MGSIFGGGSSSSTRSTNKTNSTSTTTPFSGESANNYNDYLNATKENYNSTSKNLNGLITSGKTAADTSKLDSIWGQYTNKDNTSLNNLANGSFNPNDNADWVSAQNAINSNAQKAWGAKQNQVNQNIIGTGMANGSGHQTAAYNANSAFQSQLASDQAERWATQYNQNVTNSLQANNQLSDFYNNLANIGVDYAKLSQEDMATLLNAYNQSNSALQSYGSAVAMGSNPTSTTNAISEGTSNTTQTSSPSLFSGLANLATMGAGLGWFGRKQGVK